MSIHLMYTRLNFLGGAAQFDRMVKEKRRSLIASIGRSYQSAELSFYKTDKKFTGLFNPVKQTEDFDTKLVSTIESCKTGDLIYWKNTDTHWIIFLQDRTELAYFRGQCRRCDHTISWVDKNRNKIEVLAAIIGPNNPTIDSSSSVIANSAVDSPSGVLKILVQDNPVNKEFFTRYQTFLIKGRSFQVQQIDDISMPGVLQLNASEYFSLKIEDDVEENLRNAWNVQPIIPHHKTEYGIDGPQVIKPRYQATYEALSEGGVWFVAENEKEMVLPVVFHTDILKKKILVSWEHLSSGGFTLVYKMPNGTKYERYIVVESLF